MGDGYYLSNGIALCTDSYEVDVIRLMNVLIIRYDLKCTLSRPAGGRRQKNDNYRIYISRHSIEKVRTILKSHMVPSMYYKLGINALD